MRPLIVSVLLALGVCCAIYASGGATTTPAATPSPTPSDKSATHAAPASPAKPAEAHARRAVCRKQATAKKLSGHERQVFIDHCVANPSK
jgi:hypothetical protein